MNLYTPPELDLKAFNCPHCNAYSSHQWHTLWGKVATGDGSNIVKIAVCLHCGKFSLWLGDRMSSPESTGVPLPNSDLCESIRNDYLEARSIVEKSPRGAAALLRLCIQKLCIQVGQKGDKINDDIANLVKQGLPIRVQQALDIVRVIGNSAVHPGQIDLKDDRKTALTLFSLINLIAEDMITQPKQVDEFYLTLPEPARKAIEKRDQQK